MPNYTLNKANDDVKRLVFALAKAKIKERARKLMEHSQTYVRLPIQIEPDEDDDIWDTWMLRGGRGSGKTEGASRYALKHLRKYGEHARVGIGAPTFGDARDVCAEGISGLISIAPEEFNYNRSMGEARHIKGGYVKLIGSEKPDRWNGPQWSLLWFDELALCNKESYEMSLLGLRLGAHPRMIISTTPKPKKWVKDIEEEKDEYGNQTTRVTTGTIFDNPSISERVKQRLIRKFAGTRWEKQELYGEWQEDIQGARWTRDMLEPKIAYEDMPAFARIVVALDPAVTATEDSDETGLIAAGYGIDEDWYVLADGSDIYMPAEWAANAINIFDRFQGDLFVAEVNNGGDMVGHVLRTMWNSPLYAHTRPSAILPYKAVHATRGKMIRADPVASLYDQRRVHHTYGLGELEDQLCNWTVNDKDSPDRMDALVWAITALAMEGDVRMILSDERQLQRRLISPY